MQLSKGFAESTHKEELWTIAKAIAPVMSEEEIQDYYTIIQTIADESNPSLTEADVSMLDRIFNTVDTEDHKLYGAAILLMRYVYMKGRFQFSDTTMEKLLSNTISFTMLEVRGGCECRAIETDVLRISKGLYNTYISENLVSSLRAEMRLGLGKHIPELCVMDTIYFNVGMTDEQADKLYNSILDMMTEDTPENTRHKLLAFALLTVIVYPFTRVFATNILPYFTRKTIDQIKEAGFVAISDTLDAELSSVDKMYFGLNRRINA